VYIIIGNASLVIIRDTLVFILRLLCTMVLVLWYSGDDSVIFLGWCDGLVWRYSGDDSVIL
jgi:hypothetical protein